MWEEGHAWFSDPYTRDGVQYFQVLYEFPVSHGYEGHNEWIQHPAETHTEIVHHDAEYQTITDRIWVEDKAAWTEEVVTPQYDYVTEQVWVVDEAAWTETVVTGKRCSECGATE